MVADLTNRVVLDKPIAVLSVNGPETTEIQGAWDSATTNGAAAVRCAWLASWSFRAYNADNPAGVQTNLLVHLLPIVPAVLLPGGLTGTNFTFQFGSQAGVNYAVEFATNLAPPITWRSVQNFTSTGGVVQITDMRATNRVRFYRVRAN
jgi:hypothetical protein